MKTIDENEYFDIVLKEKGVFLVDFFASWCGPCKILIPIIEELEEEMGFVAYKIDITKHTSVAKSFGVNSIPTVCIFSGGEFKEKIIGSLPKEQIRAVIQKYLV